jgi:hypothetical protein
MKIMYWFCLSLENIIRLKKLFIFVGFNLLFDIILFLMEYCDAESKQIRQM